MNDLYDDDLVDELRSGFATATYERPVTSLRRRSRVPVLLAATAAVAVAATAVVVTSDGSRSPALAWSATPRAAGAATEAQAAEECSLDGFAPPAGNGEQGTAIAGVSPDGLPPMAPPSLPATLPPLVALDVRGTGGLATYADDQWVVQCMLLPGDGGFERGVVSVSATDGSSGAVSGGNGGAPSGSVTATAGAGGQGGTGLVSVGVTVMPDGSVVSTMLGSLPAGTARVVADLPGLDPAEASLTGGFYSLWWTGSTTGGGTVRGYDASGAELWSQPLPSAPPPVIPGNGVPAGG